MFQHFPGLTTKPIPPPTLHPYTNRPGKQPVTQTGRPTMRGARPTKAIEEAQRCAEKMGYHWIKNTDPALQFNAFIFRELAIYAVIVKKIRHAIDEKTFIEKLFPDDVESLRSLPLPLHVLREIWIRTQNEREWRRFYIFPDTTGEIGFNRAEGYINPHFRKDEWKASLQHVIAWYSIKDGKLEKQA